MAVHASHAALPYPIRGARYSLLIPYLDADGDPTAPTTPDTEISKDGAAAADCTEEVSAVSGMDGVALMTFTGAELDCSAAAVKAGVASGPKPTLLTLYPRTLAVLSTGTASAGSSSTITLGTILRANIIGCFVRTTGGTGGGGSGGENNQARRITAYNATTGQCTVSPNWETAPDATTTYDVLLPEGVTAAAVHGLKLICESQGNYDAQQILSLLLSGVFGVTDGGEFSTANDGAVRADVDYSAGNRSTVTLTPSA